MNQFIDSVNGWWDGQLDGTGGSAEIWIEGMGEKICLLFRGRMEPEACKRGLDRANRLSNDVRLRLLRIFLVLGPVPARVSQLLEGIDVSSRWLDPTVKVDVRGSTFGIPDISCCVGPQI